jgi:hypothetical protein
LSYSSIENQAFLVRFTAVFHNLSQISHLKAVFDKITAVFLLFFVPNNFFWKTLIAIEQIWVAYLS